MDTPIIVETGLPIRRGQYLLSGKCGERVTGADIIRHLKNNGWTVDNVTVRCCRFQANVK